MDETKLDITPVQYSALVAIADFPGIDATRISQFISFDRATIGNVLGRLEAKGLLRRIAHAKDKRVRQTFLTPKGKRMIDLVSEATPRIAARILGPLDDDERKALMPLLAKLAMRPDANESADSTDSAAKSKTAIDESGRPAFDARLAGERRRAQRAR